MGKLSEGEEFLSVDEAARILRMKKGSVYQMTHRGQLRFYKPRGKIYFRKEDLEAFIKSGERYAGNGDDNLQ